MSDASDVDDRSAATPPTGAGGLTAAERERLEALQGAESLADLVALTGADSEHDAYFAAKEEWADLWRGLENEGDPDAALPGERVTVDGTDFHVHGVTHTGSDTERSYLRERVGRLLDAGATVYAEQGIRPLHLDGMDVCEMDDYRWALDRCGDLAEVENRFDDPLLHPADRFEVVAERLRTRAYGLIEAYSDVYGDRVEHALGTAVSTVLTDHAGWATGDEYEAFALRERAATDPTTLPALQAYYRRTFLPQPVEREWVRRHDPDLEWVTHARNARMADYAVHHHHTGPVHLIVGAAHGPGVAYYLRQHRDGERTTAGFRLA